VPRVGDRSSQWPLDGKYTHTHTHTQPESDFASVLLFCFIKYFSPKNNRFAWGLEYAFCMGLCGVPLVVLFHSLCTYVTLLDNYSCLKWGRGTSSVSPRTSVRFHDALLELPPGLGPLLRSKIDGLYSLMLVSSVCCCRAGRLCLPCQVAPPHATIAIADSSF
jgi:hypothetical protein